MLDIPVIIRLQFRVDIPYKYKKERMKHDHKSPTHGMRNITERGCVKMYTSSFLCTKPRLSQARALLFPKVFVPLGIKKISL